MPHIFEPRPAGPAVGDLAAGRRGVRGRLVSVAAAVRRAPETSLLVGVAAILNLWALGRNDWANTYYAGAVRSMASSWHAFLYASLDRAGVMTVDKPPLSLWVQALSVRVFGFHPLAILVPQALMGVASVLLVYDLVRRRFGRLGGFAAGLALATTPIFVAMSRDNNPDALLTLCCLAAAWFAVRAFEDGRTRWIVLCGVAVGLGFEAKMLIALVVVPVAALAWLWITPRGRGHLAALRQLLWGGVAMLIVGGAWPLLVALTPAADRPFVSGTSDNTILSLIFGYNGFGRVTGQTGGPARFGGVGGALGQVTGPLRLDQRRARRPGRLAARPRGRRRRGRAGREPRAPARSAHGVACGRRRRVPRDRRDLQLRRRNLPSLLRGAARPVHGGARGRRRRDRRQGRCSGRDRRSGAARGRRRVRAAGGQRLRRPAELAAGRAAARLRRRRRRPARVRTVRAAAPPRWRSAWPCS